MASEASLARLVFVLKGVRHADGGRDLVAEPGDGSRRDFRGGGGDHCGAV